MAAMVGAAIPFHRNMPAGLIPAAFADENVLVGKDGLTLLNDRPVNAETPPHLLDDAITPTARHFIRNNGIPPAEMDAEAWTLTVDGLVDRPMTYSIADLRSKFEVVTMALAIECGGNGRAFFDPPAKGNQWTYGAVACSRWTGVRLKDVLTAGGVQAGVVYTAHVGADAHLSGKPDKLPISRGVPIAKAMSDNVLIAFGQNDGPIHPMNGAPLRLVVPGWPGSCSQKWLTRIWLRDIVHDGPKMTGTAYRVPGYKVEPGEKVDRKDFRIIERMPVKSLITNPANGAAGGRRGRGAGPRLVGRPDGRGGRRLARLRGDLDAGGARRPGRRRRVAELPRERRAPRGRVLRDLGARDGQRGGDAAPRDRLEPEGLPQQHDAPRRPPCIVRRNRGGFRGLIAGLALAGAGAGAATAGEDELAERLARASPERGSRCSSSAGPAT